MITHFHDDEHDYMLLDASDVTELSDDGLDASLEVANTALHAFEFFEKNSHMREFEVVALKALKAAQARIMSVVMNEQNRRLGEASSVNCPLAAGGR